MIDSLAIAICVLLPATILLALRFSAARARAARWESRYHKAIEDRDRYRTDRNRLLKRVAALSAELNAVPNIPDPVAALRDLVERFKRIGGGLL